MSVETNLAQLVPAGHLEIMTGAQRNVEAMHRHFLAEWRDDLDAVMETLVPDDPFQHVPALGIWAEGPEAVREFYARRIATWPGQAFAIENAVVGTHVALFEGRWTVSPKGDFLGLPAKGRAVNVPGIISVSFREGLLHGETLYFDKTDMATQLAMAP